MSFVNKFMPFGGKQGRSDGHSDVPDDNSTEGEDNSNSTIDDCPYCHASLQGWWCVSCDVEFALEDDKLVERLLSARGPRAARRCMSCDTPMERGGQFTAAWEDGDNADAYITCPGCGYQNAF
jgi:DNA-directed RNA polymerase subunit RPC12/RpoP